MSVTGKTSLVSQLITNQSLFSENSHIWCHRQASPIYLVWFSVHVHNTSWLITVLAPSFTCLQEYIQQENFHSYSSACLSLGFLLNILWFVKCFVCASVDRRIDLKKLIMVYSSLDLNFRAEIGLWHWYTVYTETCLMCYHKLCSAEITSLSVIP